MELSEYLMECKDEGCCATAATLRLFAAFNGATND